ncbi:hypothetical protein D3C81_2298210 [compost metagenome]
MDPPNILFLLMQRQVLIVRILAVKATRLNPLGAEERLGDCMASSILTATLEMNVS